MDDSLNILKLIQQIDKPAYDLVKHAPEKIDHLAHE
jgi:hypothetical protein